jgi:hypothetical protein
MPIIEHRLVGECLNSLGMGWWTIDQTLVNVHNVTYDQTPNKKHLCLTIFTLLTNNFVVVFNLGGNIWHLFNFSDKYSLEL